MKYSVIIPVFNAEKTLQRCLDSLLSEQYMDMEIILINDGSKDRSREICENYVLEHKNIQFVDKKNGGVSTARNTGLDIASGEYILFVDSDDYVSNSYFSSLDRMVNKYPCDLIQFSINFVKGNSIKKREFSPVVTMTREETLPLIIDAMCRKTINGPVAKVYRSSIIQKNYIRFQEGVSVAEDRAFNICYSMHINSYAVTDEAIYFAVTENNESLSRGRHSNLNYQFQLAEDYIQIALRNAQISAEEKEKYQHALNFGICRGIYHDAKIFHKDKLSWIERNKQLWILCKEMNKKKMKYPKGKYCSLIIAPVFFRLTPLIDVIAWKLTH